MMFLIRLVALSDHLLRPSAPQETPFTTKKEILAGEIQKIRQRVFLVGRVGVARPQASGLSLRILLKISSSLVVKIHH